MEEDLNLDNLRKIIIIQAYTKYPTLPEEGIAKLLGISTKCLYRDRKRLNITRDFSQIKRSR